MLEAARLVICERGPDFTLAEVAERAGVSAGSFYQYFPDRLALAGALIDEQIAEDRQLVSEVAKVLQGVEVTKLPHLVAGGILKMYGESPLLLSYMVRLMHELGRYGDLQGVIAEFAAVLSQALHEALPERSPDECSLATSAALSAVLGMVRRAAETEPALLHDATFSNKVAAVCAAALGVGWGVDPAFESGRLK